jgi:hypothetical protein
MSTWKQVEDLLDILKSTSTLTNPELKLVGTVDFVSKRRITITVMAITKHFLPIFSLPFCTKSSKLINQVLSVLLFSVDESLLFGPLVPPSRPLPWSL